MGTELWALAEVCGQTQGAQVTRGGAVTATQAHIDRLYKRSSTQLGSSLNVKARRFPQLAEERGAVAIGFVKQS